MGQKQSMLPVLRWNLSIKIVAAYSGLIALMGVLLTTTLYWQFCTANQQVMRDHLLDLLSLTAPEIDSEYHSLTLTSEDTNKPYYKINLEKLKTVQAASKDINRIYTLRPKSNGQFIFILHLESTAKSSISVGQMLENVTPILSAEGTTLSQPKVEKDFFESTEGKFLLYGYAPIKDQFGRLEGILAIELDATSIVQAEQVSAAIALGVFWLGVLLVILILALTVVIVRWLARSLIVNLTLRLIIVDLTLHLNNAAKKLADLEEYSHTLERKLDDGAKKLADLERYSYILEHKLNDAAKKFADLERYSHTLERKVKERTIELEKAKLIADSANQARGLVPTKEALIATQMKQITTYNNPSVLALQNYLHNFKYKKILVLVAKGAAISVGLICALPILFLYAIFRGFDD